MRSSVVIASLNEGERLWKTVRSVLQTTKGLDCEVVVADDASTDGSVEEMRKRYPGVTLVAHKSRKGCSPTKDLGARASRGGVLVFLDGHCKPERGAIEKLVSAVEGQDGEAIIMPRVPALDCERWQNSKELVGRCFSLDLVKLAGEWQSLEGAWMRGHFYESAGLVGCCVAVSRWLYDELGGFDAEMWEWGIEDVDLGLRAWLMGYSVLHDPDSVIGHRFSGRFDNFTVAQANVLANKMRMARKSFADPTWREWIRKSRSRRSKKTWNVAWKVFQKYRISVERERERLLSRRVHDEFWFARRFGLKWPRRPGQAALASRKRSAPAHEPRS